MNKTGTRKIETERLILRRFVIEDADDMFNGCSSLNTLDISGFNTRYIENTGERYISRGIDKTGALIVEDSCGNIKYVSSGEVSVRGVYGYV